MIKSNFIADIIDLLLDGDADGETSRLQLALITDTVYGYTSGGLFVSFSHPESIKPYKCTKDDLILNGVKITSDGLDFEADATLFFRNGIMDHMEISCCQGVYPRRDLTCYSLTQAWDGAPGRSVCKQ